MAPQQLQRENPGGLLKVYTDTTAFARHIAAFTSDRWRCLMGMSTLEPASENQTAANAAAEAIRATGTSPGARAIGQLPPPWRAWLAGKDVRPHLRGRSVTAHHHMSDTAVFQDPPSLLADTVESARHLDWRCSFETWVDSSSDRLYTDNWPSSALLTVVDDGSDEAAGLLGQRGYLYRMAHTRYNRPRARHGHTVVMAIQWKR